MLKLTCLFIFIPLLYAGCSNEKEGHDKAEVSIIEGSIPTLEGKKLYLVEAHHWRVKLDSTIVKDGKFRFSIPHDSAFVPYKVSINYDDSLSPTGISSVLFTNDYLEPTKETGFKPYRTDAFYMEDGTVALTEDSLLSKTENPNAKQVISFMTRRESYPNLHVSVKAGPQTEVMYQMERNDFGWIGNADSMKRTRLVTTYKKKIAQYPYSYVLMDDIYNYRDQYTKDELREIKGMFDPALQKSLKGDRFEKYLNIRLDPGTPLPSLSLRDPSGVYHSALSNTAPVNIIVLWASWCVPCREEIPMIKEIYQHFKNRGVNLVSISIDKSEASWKKALSQENMKWPQFIVDSSEIEHFTNQLSTPAIPTIIFTDGRRAELKRLIGSGSTTKQKIIDFVESQLSDRLQLK